MINHILLNTGPVSAFWLLPFLPFGQPVPAFWASIALQGRSHRKIYLHLKAPRFDLHRTRSLRIAAPRAPPAARFFLEHRDGATEASPTERRLYSV